MSALPTSAPRPHVAPPTAATKAEKLEAERSALDKAEDQVDKGRERGVEQLDLAKTAATGRTMSPTLLPSPPPTTPCNQRISPRGSPLMRPMGASCNRRIRSASPGLHSPASSLIFERNVQEPEPSADVPAHIKTEDYIPPALDASSLAITDGGLNPDEVEIVMHSAHQPAAAVVANSMSDSLHSPLLAHEEAGAPTHVELAEPASGYGSLDMTDPRRLSFISFADVVQAEHVEQDRQEMLGTGTSAAEGLHFPSLSPVQSPAHAGGLGAFSPTSGAVSPKLVDRELTQPLGSPASPAAGTHSPSLGMEPPLQIETMRQALRKTHSGDLSGLPVHALPPAAAEDNTANKTSGGLK